MWIVIKEAGKQPTNSICHVTGGVDWMCLRTASFILSQTIAPLYFSVQNIEYEDKDNIKNKSVFYNLFKTIVSSIFNCPGT